MADEKKIALIVELKTEGQDKAQKGSVSLKDMSSAHSDATKKSSDHGRAIEALTKKIMGLVTIREAIKVIKDLGRAFVDSVQQGVAFQSEFAPLRVGFEESASRMKTAFAGISSVALPAVIGFQKAIGDALTELSGFIDQNRELVATDIAGWAADGARFVVGAFGTAVSLASKSINGLRMAYHEVASFVSFVQGDSKAQDMHEGAAAKALSDMNKIDATIDSLTKKADSYIGKAVKVAGEMAKATVSPVDPEMEARRTAEFDHQLALRLGIIQRNGNTEQAIEQALVLQHEVFEEKKRSTTRDRARQEQMQLIALGQLIHTLEMRRVAEAEQRSALLKQLSDGVAATELENLQRVAEQEGRDQDHRNMLRDREVADFQDKIGRMESGFGKAQAEMTLASKLQSERRLALEQGNIERAQKLDEEAIQARKAAYVETFDTVKSIASTVVASVKSFVKAGLDGTKDMGQVAIGIVSSIGEAIIDKLLAMFVSFISEQIAELLTKSALQASVGVAAAASNIAAEAAVAGASAVAATAAIPIVGPALAPAAGAAAYAEAMSFQGFLAAAAMADGGLVIGGAIGRDSVPAMLMPGEYVVTAAQVRQNVAAGRAPDDSGPARRGGGGGGAGLAVTVVQHNTVPMSQAELDRRIADAIIPSIQRIARSGGLRLK